MKKADNDHGHVVAADASGLTVGRQAVVHHVLTDTVQFLLGGNSSSDKFYDCLRRLAIPDTYESQ